MVRILQADYGLALDAAVVHQLDGVTDEDSLEEGVVASGPFVAENAAFGGVSGFHRGQTSFQGIDCNRNFHMRFLLFGVLDPIHCYFQMEIETFLDSYASFYYNTIGHWIQYWMLHFRKQIWHLSHV